VLDGDTPRIVADPYRNALIIRDTPERLAMYEDLVRHLDVESQIIQLDATVIDIDKSRVRQLGIDWTYQHGNTGAAFGGGVHPLDGMLNLAGLQVNSIITDASTFTARLNALEQEGVTNIVQRPQVVTLNDAEAVIESTQSVYVPVSGAFDEDLFGVMAGTVLRVTPHIIVDNGRQRIRLLVTIEDGNIQVSNQPTTGTNGQTLSQAVPSVVRNAVNTQAIIDVGQGLLLGGLNRRENTRTTNRIPLLGSIPLLGRLFRSDVTKRDTTERLFLISPQIIVATAASLGGPLKK
jgi:type III secretion protein C